jgi:hypothetical protein
MGQERGRGVVRAHQNRRGIPLESADSGEESQWIGGGSREKKEGEERGNRGE